MIFFDIDGTLLNQRRAELAAARQLLRTFRSELPDEVTTLTLCRNWRNLRERHLPAWLDQQVPYVEYHRRRIRELFGRCDMSDAEADLRYDVFHQAYRRAWTPYSDVTRMLSAISHLPLGVISNGSGAHQRQKLHDTGLLHAFSVVVISEEVHAAKPDPEIFLEAAHQAGEDAADCVFVGDRLETDIWPSRAAGMQGIWLNRRGGFHHTVPTIQSLSALPRWIERRGLTPPLVREPVRIPMLSGGFNPAAHQ